jgi:hypothetical protein
LFGLVEISGVAPLGGFQEEKAAMPIALAFRRHDALAALEDTNIQAVPLGSTA